MLEKFENHDKIILEQEPNSSDNTINIDGIDIGIRYFGDVEEPFLSRFKKTEALKKAGVESRLKDGHGYVMPHITDGKVVGWDVPLTDEKGFQDSMFFEENPSYEIDLNMTDKRGHPWKIRNT